MNDDLIGALARVTLTTVGAWSLSVGIGGVIGNFIVNKEKTSSLLAMIFGMLCFILRTLLAK